MFSYAWLGSYEQHICLAAFPVFMRTTTLKPSVDRGGRETGRGRLQGRKGIL